MKTSNISYMSPTESPYHRGFNIVILNLWFPVMCFVDSCHQPCVRTHKDTECFNIFVWIPTVASCPKGCSGLGDYLCNGSLSEVTHQWVMGIFTTWDPMTFLFCDHRNIMWQPTPPSFICQTANVGKRATKLQRVLTQLHLQLDGSSYGLRGIRLLPVCCTNVAHYSTVLWGVHWSQTLLRFIWHLPPSSQLENRKAVFNSFCCSTAHGLRLLFVSPLSAYM